MILLATDKENTLLCYQVCNMNQRLSTLFKHNINSLLSKWKHPSSFVSLILFQMSTNILWVNTPPPLWSSDSLGCRSNRWHLLYPGDMPSNHCFQQLIDLFIHQMILHHTCSLHAGSIPDNQQPGGQTGPGWRINHCYLIYREENKGWRTTEIRSCSWPFQSITFINKTIIYHLKSMSSLIPARCKQPGLNPS